MAALNLLEAKQAPRSAAGKWFPRLAKAVKKVGSTDFCLLLPLPLPLPLPSAVAL
jgi:hypothetical protein